MAADDASTTPSGQIDGGRLRRTAPLAGWAARTAGEAVIAALRRSGGGVPDAAEFHARTAERYAELLGRSKGVLMKAGQMLSFVSLGTAVPLSTGRSTKPRWAACKPTPRPWPPSCQEGGAISICRRLGAAVAGSSDRKRPLLPLYGQRSAPRFRSGLFFLAVTVLCSVGLVISTEAPALAECNGTNYNYSQQFSQANNFLGVERFISTPPSRLNDYANDFFTVFFTAFESGTNYALFDVYLNNTYFGTFEQYQADNSISATAEMYSSNQIGAHCPTISTNGGDAWFGTNGYGSASSGAWLDNTNDGKNWSEWTSGVNLTQNYEFDRIVSNSAFGAKGGTD